MRLGLSRATTPRPECSELKIYVIYDMFMGKKGGLTCRTEGSEGGEPGEVRERKSASGRPDLAVGHFWRPRHRHHKEV
jgi:hypothetical protein